MVVYVHALCGITQTILIERNGSEDLNSIWNSGSTTSFARARFNAHTYFPMGHIYLRLSDRTAWTAIRPSIQPSGTCTIAKSH
jgi:hypothetical protein